MTKNAVIRNRIYVVVDRVHMFIKKCKIFIVFILLAIQAVNAQDTSVGDGTSSDNVVRKNIAEQTDARHLYVKTNAVGWGFLIANIAGEIDLGKQWSFALPVYYTACNYFSSKVKFRTTSFQPEIRYWFDDNHSGWFAGAHIGISWFNFAMGGDYRYQDYHCHTPAWGGGLNGGYRMPIHRNQRWWLEFSLGTGIYKVKLDKFENRNNGQWVETEKRTYWGIDQVGVSFAYRFDLKKKKQR